ncbi:MAG: hypothetical protein HXL36_07210, partial [Prevotellaceae bacterium]|nr:hypothetical protein [Prevotellaceae bacterium]
MQGIGLAEFEFLRDSCCAAHEGKESVGAFPDSTQLPVQKLYFNSW